MLAQLRTRIRQCLSDDLRKPRYRDSPSRMAGHCYVASEAALHVLGESWKPEVVKHEGETHWYLRHRETGEIFDATADQFQTTPPYCEGIGKGFLTKQPSKRAKVLLARLRELC